MEQRNREFYRNRFGGTEEITYSEKKTIEGATFQIKG